MSETEPRGTASVARAGQVGIWRGLWRTAAVALPPARAGWDSGIACSVRLARILILPASASQLRHPLGPGARARSPCALRGIVALVAATWLAVGGSAIAATDTAKDAELLPPVPLHERVLSLPGDSARPATLQVILFTPDGPGPFPLAVLNHGTAPSGRPKDEPRHRTTFAAYYFLSRGYAVVLPMMRGYAGSDGRVEPHGCDVASAGINNARDIMAVIDAVARQPEIDTSRIVIAGQSFGGWNTLASGTLGRAGVKGLVNFAGGMRESDCPARDQDISLIAAAGFLGAHTRLPRSFARAFVVAPSGAVVITNGGFDPIARALDICHQHVAGCQLYAVDNDVVWTGPKPATAERIEKPIYRRTVLAGTTTTLDFSYGVNPDCSPRGVPKLWLVQPPTHGAARITQRMDFPRFPPNHPYAACNWLRVPGVAVEYTPETGFNGSDSLVFEEIDLDHLDLVFRFAVAVK